eukprot:5053207-Amphidinium_carterae.1
MSSQADSMFDVPRGSSCSAGVVPDRKGVIQCREAKVGWQHGAAGIRAQARDSSARDTGGRQDDERHATVNPWC